jgi:hypothetical protein
MEWCNSGKHLGFARFLGDRFLAGSEAVLAKVRALCADEEIVWIRVVSRAADAPERPPFTIRNQSRH